MHLFLINFDWDIPQNLRFQGQYLDRETGLHYNTFLYYDPNLYLGCQNKRCNIVR
ncbi:hypothetical protein N7922_01355 [Kosakonia sp. ML.JS2a]|nr:RHS repeat-associated core domain-containing protein [Kosakonia sp. ML.JS2a]UXY13274.1 hypothetical protein N7922_01355 [Kosakonia sp. ML.JS2a]